MPRDPLEIINELHQRKYENTRSFEQIRASLINQFRNLVLQMAIIDAGAIFALPGVLERVKNFDFLVLSVILLFVPLLVSLFYLTIVIDEDLKQSTKGFREVQTLHQKAIDAIKNDRVQEFLSEEQQPEWKQEKYFDVKLMIFLIILFSVGLVFFFLSFI